MKRMILIALLAAMILLIVLFPAEALLSARQGWALWAQMIVPSLLPFFVAVNTIGEMGGTRAVSRIIGKAMYPLFRCPSVTGFVLVCSMLAGYPLGAKMIGSLLENGTVTKQQAARMLPLCSTSGPLFILGAVGAGILQNVRAGVCILIAHYLAVIFTGVVCSRFYKDDPKAMRSHMNTAKPLPFGQAFGKSIRAGMESMLIIGGCVVFFSVALGFLTNTGFAAQLSAHSPVFTVLLKGFVELSNGCAAAGALTGALSVGLCAAIISWGGLCVHAQALALLGDVDKRPFFIGKALHAIIAFLLAMLLYRSAAALPAFNPLPNEVYFSQVSFWLAVAFAIIAMVSFLVFTLALWLWDKRIRPFIIKKRRITQRARV